MASEDQINRLNELANAIRSVDREKLMRTSLGEASLEQQFVPRSTKIEGKLQYVLDHASEVDSDNVENTLGVIEQIRNEIDQQAALSTADYVANTENFLQNIDVYLEQLKQFWPPFITAAVESRGFLEDEGVRKEYESTIRSIKEESDSALEQVRNEAKRTIDEAQTLAEQIENRARMTASGISVEEAQKQFREAQRGLDRGVKIWAVIGGIFIAGFVLAAWQFAKADLPDQWRWEVVYYSAIRVSILAAIGTVAAFCLRIFRAQMHMSEKNRHRQRVANSIGAFVESAVTPEQRDQILSQLVESVIQFGNSGLLQNEDDNVYRPKMTIDSIMRTLSSSSGKQQSGM